MRAATFTRMGQGTRKLWVLRVEGGEAPKPGDRLEVKKRDGTVEEKVVLKCVFTGTKGGSPDAPPLYLCTFLGKRDSRMLVLANEYLASTWAEADLGALMDLTEELAQLVLEKLTPKGGGEEKEP